MIPNASEITRRRLTASMILRMLAVVVLLFAMIPLIVLGVELVSGYNSWISTLSDALPYLVGSGIPSVVSITLWLLAPWAARLMIRVPRVAVCPNCKYKLEGLMSPQCTECGYTLTPEFMTTPDEREAGRHEPDTVLLRQISTLVVRLVSGIFFLISMSASFGSAVAVIENPGWNSWYTVYTWAWISLVTIAILIFARRLSIMFVPGRVKFERTTDGENR